MYRALKVLTSTKESTFMNWILLILIRYPITKQRMLNEVEFILKLDGCDTPFTMTCFRKSWYQWFTNEYKDVLAWIAQGVSKPQVDVMKDELE